MVLETLERKIADQGKLCNCQNFLGSKLTLTNESYKASFHGRYSQNEEHHNLEKKADRALKQQGMGPPEWKIEIPDQTLQSTAKGKTKVVRH
jgi:hypothetical protein